MKARGRRSLASAIVETLVDLNTWLQSCAMGSNTKPALDPRVMKYVEKTVFNYYPIKPPETYKQAWQDCITNIDNRARDIKRRLKEKSHKK